MSKQMTSKPQTVSPATFELANNVKHWLNEYGQSVSIKIDPNNDQQMFVLPEFSCDDMQSFGIDTYDMPNSDAAWCDWYSSAIIVVGPNVPNDKEPMNEDDHDDVATALQAQVARPRGAPDTEFIATTLLKQMVEMIESHEVTCFSCDRDGERYCDCLQCLVKNAKANLNI